MTDISEAAQATAESPAGRRLRRDGNPTLICDYCGGPICDRKPGAWFCSDRCKSANWERLYPRVHKVPVQAQLLEPPPAMLRPLDCPYKAKARKLKKAALLILGRLQEGEASILDLVALGGWRTAARIYELRAAGHRILGPQKSVRFGIYETIPAGRDGADRYRLEVRG